MTRAARCPRPEVPARLAPLITSWDLHLQGIQGAAPKTRTIYLDAVRWLAGSLAPGVTWAQVCKDPAHLRGFFAMLAEGGYSRSYISSIGRALQQWCHWLAREEDLPDPLAAGGRLAVPPAPKAGTVRREVLTGEQLAALIRAAEGGKGFADRRDAAILRLYACTGCRLAELVVDVEAVDLARREVTVVGKASKIRTVRIDAKAAVALDRYLRARASHPHAAESRALWLGVRRRAGMTTWGIYQAIERRGRQAGLTLHPHLLRHTFAHRWLDAGGGEGDLMELMGWESPQMLRHYGASARGARARRAYDRVDPLGGI